MILTEGNITKVTVLNQTGLQVTRQLEHGPIEVDDAIENQKIAKALGRVAKLAALTYESNEHVAVRQLTKLGFKAAALGFRTMEVSLLVETADGTSYVVSVIGTPYDFWSTQSPRVTVQWLQQ